MHSFSFGELALIFGIIIVLFGGSRLASVGKSLGEGISNFKKGLNSGSSDSDKSKLSAPSSVTQNTTTHHQVVDAEHQQNDTSKS